MMREGTHLASQLMHRVMRRPHERPPTEPLAFGARPAITLAVAVAVIVLGLLIFFGLIAGGLKIVEYSKPVVSWVGGLVFPLLFALLFMPGGAPMLAALILVIGLSIANRFRDPGLFIMGLVIVDLGILAFWQLPTVLGALRPDARTELEGPLLIVGLIITLFLVVCGFQLMGISGWIGKQKDSEDDEAI